jgi:hypothetical protein
MNSENNFQDPVLDQALLEIRVEAVDPTVIEAAASRVWARLAEAAAVPPPEHLRTCADFQALIPDFRAGHLPDGRALLVKDHLHECVACRRVYEGRVVAMPSASARAPKRGSYLYVWAAAAVVLIAAGVTWYELRPGGVLVGRPIVQAINSGALYLMASDGTLHPLAVNQELPDGAEIRTAKDSDALLRLRDGSVVELRERSSFTTTHAGTDVTVRLGRGSVIVEAAKRRQGHLYVDTADCQVAVTGTIFGVSAGVKGSRVSVVQGEVHVSEGNSNKVLHPGDQTVTGEDLEPTPVKEDISWSIHRDHYYTLLQQLSDLRADLEKIHLPGLRYSSRLLARLPASTVLFGSIPNLADYLAQAESTVNRKMDQSPELRAWWQERSSHITPILETLRSGSEYLGDEIVIAAATNPQGRLSAPVFLAEVKRPGFPEFLRSKIGAIPVEMRNGLVLFGPDRDAVAAMAPALDTASGGFAGTPFYARIDEAYKFGAGLMICADLSRMGIEPHGIHLQYFIAEQKEVNRQPETRATIGFSGDSTGIGSWLAAPAPMGALDYVSPDATLLGAFVVRNPADILNQVTGVVNKTPQDLGPMAGIHNDLIGSLGGEFAIAMDGPAFPVPSWKLVTEVYNPGRFQSALDRLVTAVNQKLTAEGKLPLRTAQEVVDGRRYYMLAAGQPNPLLEAHYTYADGYLIAAPSRALVAQALQVKQSRTSIMRSTRFMELTPRDHYTNFSGVFYQNLGTTLAPIAGLLGSMAPQQDAASQRAIQSLSNFKPLLVALYAEPDRITMASDGDALGMSLTALLTGGPGQWAGGLMPSLGQFTGTRERMKSYR